MDKQVVLSGVRPTGQLHLGNYFGAIRQWIEYSLDSEVDSFFFVASLHGLTTPFDAATLRQDQIDLVRGFMAAGLDPDRVTLYAQQNIPELSELTWLLSCISPLGQLASMPHFKEKRAGMADGGLEENAGLLFYPVLMAADILGPKADWVPVGEDQLPHLEFTQRLARHFNRDFCPSDQPLFPRPEKMLTKAPRVMSLDGRGKMSKSEPDGAIFLDDPSEVVWARLRPAKTDEQRQRLTDPGDPDKCNVYDLHKMVSPADVQDEIAEGCRSAGIGCIDCKKHLHTHLDVLLDPMRERLADLRAAGDDQVIDVLSVGGERARKRIAPTVELAKARMGVGPFRTS